MPASNITSIDGSAISSFSFGTMQFGENADEVESRKMYGACRNAGINFFDTAYVYTGGKSETILGQLVKPERDKIIVATKCAMAGGSGAANIRAQCEESLKRLDMDVVDIMYLHKFNDDTPLEESFETLADLQKSGKIRYIGVSNFSAWQTMKARRIAEELGTDIAILQPMYSLVKRQVEAEILPMASSEGFSVAPYSPLGGGLLTGKYASGGSGRISDNDMYNTRYKVDWMHETARQLADMAAEIGVHPATLAVAWVAANPSITQPIISARSLEQLRPSLDAINYPMTNEIYAKITELSQAPALATDRLEEA